MDPGISDLVPPDLVWSLLIRTLMAPAPSCIAGLILEHSRRFMKVCKALRPGLEPVILGCVHDSFKAALITKKKPAGLDEAA
eukprot:82947-Chlamydomonas_euryale.AAC.2